MPAMASSANRMEYHVHNTTTRIDHDDDPMYWVVPVGLVLGLLVVWVFERHTSTGGSVKRRKAFFRKLAAPVANRYREAPGTSAEDAAPILDASVYEKLERPINGQSNIAQFYSGGAILHQGNHSASAQYYTKVYERLSLVSALLLTISVNFYTANKVHNHIYGLICCVTNCVMWFATVSSVFFSAALSTVGTCRDEKQVTSQEFFPFSSVPHRAAG